MMEREGRLGQDTGWQEVINKKKNRTQEGRGWLDVATSAWRVPYKDTVSFYFSEFPETHGAKEMLKAFRLYGEAMEVVIPPKRDKFGKRFGFVRFRNVVDPGLFAVKLDNIIFGANKIHVNVPRFQREWKEKPISRPIQQHREAHRGGVTFLSAQQQQVTQKAGRQLGAWRTKEGGQTIGRDREGNQKVWRKKESGVPTERGEEKEQHDRRMNHRRDAKEEAPKIIYHRKNNIAEVCYNVSEEDMQNFKKMFVGTVRTPGSTYSVHEWFSMQGFFLLKITPMGANKVLMEELEEGVFQELMTNHKEWMYEKFDDIRGWEPNEVDNERVVWVRCHGIPIHAWNEEFFASLARNFGEYLGIDEATRSRSEVDVARILLRSNGYDVFNAVVTANINGSLFHVKIVEEWCGPIRWLENSPLKDIDVGDGTDSDDSHGDDPPLFTEADGWCSSYETERDDDVEECDDQTIVQETIEGNTIVFNDESGNHLLSRNDDVKEGGA